MVDCTMSATQETNNFVVIGDYLGVIEEFIPGPGTYENDGKIYSARIGVKHVNKRTLEVSVDPVRKRDIPVPQPGDVVICEIVIARRQMAICSIFKHKNMFLFDTYSGALHVSNMAPGYMRSVEDGFKPTDIVRARVMRKDFTKYELTTKYPELGVIYAECSNCGTTLRRDGDRIVCDLCGYHNPRKFAKDYGRVRERIDNLH